MLKFFINSIKKYLQKRCIRSDQVGEGQKDSLLHHVLGLILPHNASWFIHQFVWNCQRFRFLLFLKQKMYAKIVSFSIKIFSCIMHLMFNWRIKKFSRKDLLHWKEKSKVWIKWVIGLNKNLIYYKTFNEEIF